MMLPQNLKAKLANDEDSEPSATKSKLIYKRCADCGLKKDKKTKYI